MSVENGREAKAVEENTLAVRVTNVLLLAQAQNVDATKPLEVQKMLRYLKVIESVVKSSDSDD